MPQIFTAVVMANFACCLFVYGLIRLRRNESDRGAIGIVLACLAVIGLMGWSAHSTLQEQPRTGSGSSAALASGQQ